MQLETAGSVTWMSDGAATVVPDALRGQATDVEWLEAETGLRHLGTEAHEVVVRPFARRALIVARPFLVAMRARKPWLRLRFRTEG
jgi:hypothetical protein